MRGTAKTRRTGPEGLFPADLSVSVRLERAVAVVEVTGEIDLTTAPRLRSAIAELVANGHQKIVIDLRAVTFLDSTGLGLIAGAMKRLRAHDGALGLVSDGQPVLGLLRLTGLSRVIPVSATVLEALDVCGTAGA